MALTCGHCRSSVEQALRAVAGVADVQVSLEQRLATVTGVGLRIEALVAAVKAGGFEAAPAAC